MRKYSSKRSEEEVDQVCIPKAPNESYFKLQIHIYSASDPLEVVGLHSISSPRDLNKVFFEDDES